MTQTLQYQTATAIDAAADLIEEKGWCRGKYRDGDRHCTLGALLDVAGVDDSTYTAAYEAVTAEVRIQPGSSSYATIPMWNDDQRDRRKVIRLLRRTARKVRRGQISV